jgi:hypothetical protein
MVQCNDDSRLRPLDVDIHKLTLQDLSTAHQKEMLANAAESQQKEMHLGRDSFTFQFHHLEVLLFRHDESDTIRCLDPARKALSILPRLMSTSEQVYNGVVW